MKRREINGSGYPYIADFGLVVPCLSFIFSMRGKDNNSNCVLEVEHQECNSLLQGSDEGGIPTGLSSEQSFSLSSQVLVK